MHKNWYRRMLLSYFPIFLFTVTMLIFLSFLVVNEISREETVKADRISTGFIVDTVQRSLREIEMNTLEEFASNERYNSYLQGGSASSERVDLLEAAERMRQLASDDPLIDSIYLFRRADRQVLTSSGPVAWQDFADQPFIEEALENPEYRGWSEVRNYHTFSAESSNRVISLYKRGPLPFGTQGFFVINVNMYALERIIQSMNNNELSYLHVRDRAGNVVFSTRPQTSEGETPVEGKVLNALELDMLGWTFESGIKAGELFVWVSVISYVWIALAIATVLLATVYIVYITRRNYRPIRAMMGRVEALQARGGGAGTKLDELSLIDQTLESLITQMSAYEKEQRDHLLASRRQLFLDLILGERLEEADERLARLSPLNMLTPHSPLSVVVADMTGFDEFKRALSAKEQHTMRFALTNVLQEIAREEQLAGWAEWIGESRLCLIFGIGGESDQNHNVRTRLRSFADKGHAWIAEHLHITLAIGIGPVEREWSRVGVSYKAAAEALRHKLSKGHAFVIMSDELPGDTSRSWFKHLQSMAEFVKEFRLTNGEWRSRLERLMNELADDCLKDEDIRMLLTTMMDMLGRELAPLADSLEAYFRGNSYEAWKREVLQLDSIGQLTALYRERLTEIFRTYVAICETKSHHAMIGEMKAYIEEHFANPDLSLKHLSDRFAIPAKYASYLFKEAFDMKFVDFLVQLRMAQAEKLLAETGDTVQNIAMLVGYANSITFGRMFKRVVGVTPGDYRRLRMSPSYEANVPIGGQLRG